MKMSLKHRVTTSCKRQEAKGRAAGINFFNKRTAHSLLLEKTRKTLQSKLSTSGRTRQQGKENASSVASARFRRQVVDENKDSSSSSSSTSQWVLRAALEDALHDPALNDAALKNLGNPREPSAKEKEKERIHLSVPQSCTPVDVGDVKIRVARNSEELKSVAALRVGIFQKFPKDQQLQEKDGKGSGKRSGGKLQQATATAAAAGGRSRPSAHFKRSAALLNNGKNQEVMTYSQWLRRTSGLEAARIYNLGERCICLLAVYHPKDKGSGAEESSSSSSSSSSNESFNNGRSSSLGERLLSPFFRWHAPPVPKVPSLPIDQNHQYKLDNDEDGGLIIGTLNIHFGQPCKPAPQKKTRSPSLWNMKQRQRYYQNNQLGYFQLPSEEKTLQKLNRGCKQAYIFNLCVSPAFRRQGIATMLLDRAHEIANERLVPECFLHVDFGNDAAEKLYEENGYVFEDDEEGKWSYIAGSRPRQLMKKRLIK